jgi:single-stranded-DNA-specific exonuclease
MQKVIIRHQHAEELHESLQDLHPLLQRIYGARGIKTAAELERELHHLLPPHYLKGLEAALSCLLSALHAQATILIIGDFDADGATSTALAVLALRSLGAKNVSYLVPNRFTYGYGLTPEIVDVAAKLNPQLIITVDNGIASFAGVLKAKELGIKVLITDHHLAGKELPLADAIVNPNQPNDEFPSKCMAGVGVIFYVMLALRSRLKETGWFAAQGIPVPNMAQFLDLVALGSVADVAPLDKNNRILVHQGLQRIRAGQCRPGIRALLEVAKRDPQSLVASDLGFAVGPRLNAAGRLDDMSFGIECLLTEDYAKALQMAVELDSLNQERRHIEVDMQQQALQALEKLQLKEDLPLGLCLFDPNWHPGVAGLLASRIKERLHRPVIVFTPSHNQELKGSARSVAGLHIRDVLDTVATRHPDLLSKFGGHAMAAGLSIEQEKYQPFCQAFDAEVRRHLRSADLQGKIYSDGELNSGQFSLETAMMLRAAGPWGQAFPEPLFDGIFNIIDQRLVGQKHLKLTLQAIDHAGFLDAIAFNIDYNHWPNHRCEQIRAAYRLDINAFRGLSKVQLLIEYLEAIL